MLKTAPVRLLPATLLFALVGLAGCHVSFGSGSSSQSPGSVQGKPAKKSTRSPSSSRTSKPSSKAINKADSKPTNSGPTRAPADDKTTDDGPHRDQPASTDPKRTLPTDDPTRTDPTDEPTRTPKHIGNGKAGGGGAGDQDEPSPGANTIDRPGSVTTPTKKPGGAKEIARPTTVTAPQ